MSALQLLRVEMIKLRRRTAFVVMVALFVIGTAIVFGVRAILARSSAGEAMPFALPRSAAEIHGVLQPLVMFFSFVTVVNLTAAEFPWRTARQNVIDGLSREQFFTAKLLLVPLTTILFFVVGYGIALLVAATGGVDGAIVSAPVLKAMLGGIVTAIGFSSLALLAAFATRHTAGAIAIVLGYLMFGEPVLGAILGRGGDALGRLAAYLPANVFTSVSSLGQYMPGARFFPSVHEPIATPILLVMAFVYVAVFCGGAYLLVRRQDL